MTAIHSIPSPIVVPAFGQGVAVQAPTRAEFDTAGMNTLADAVVARQAFALPGSSMQAQPQLRRPEGVAVTDALVRDAIALVANEQIPADVALQRSFDRHVLQASELADHVASSQDALS